MSTMPGRFAGRVAVVTGGGAGIGAAICQRLDQEGAQILVADIDGGAADQVAQGLARSIACQVWSLEEPFITRAAPVLQGVSPASQVDMSDEKQVEELVAKVITWSGKLDIWVNNAAKFVFGAATTASDAGNRFNSSSAAVMRLVRVHK